MYKLLSILLFAFCLAVTTEDIYDDSWAVIIGINEYEHVDELNYAVQDAEAIKDLLISNFNFPKENIIMLTDEDASLTNIKTKLFEVATSVNKSDRLLVYYAGHGETYNLKSGGERGYLIPVDGNLDNIFATCLPMSDIKEVANVTEAKHVLFLMDACYGGLLAVDTRGLSKSTPGYIDKITRDNARQIITAGGKGEQVIEKSEWGHSAFAKNLLHGLETGIADEDSDGYITADELGSFLKKRVTIDSDNFQTPVKRRFGSDEGEFVFINNMYIENQTINFLSKTDNKSRIRDFQSLDELREEIVLLKALLKEEINKPIKFIQGCTDEVAINYNPDANLDDDSCIILDSNSSYFRFGEYNPIDSTLDIYFQTGVGFYGITALSFTTTGFKILDVLAGSILEKEWEFNLNEKDVKFFTENYKYDIDAKLKASYGEKLLLKAKILDNRSKYLTEYTIYGSELYGEEDSTWVELVGCTDRQACNYHFMAKGFDANSCFYDCSYEEKIHKFCIQSIEVDSKSTWNNRIFNGGCLILSKPYE